MPRQARIVRLNIPHHITQRGNRRQNIFFSSYNRSFFLELLKHYSEKFSIELIAYCLMTNHIHVVAVPGSSDSFHLAFKSIFRRYGSFKNTIAGWTGHFWQERFFSSPLDEGHFWTALRYVELNPVRAKMVAQAETAPIVPAPARTVMESLICYWRVIPSGIGSSTAFGLEGVSFCSGS